MIRIAQIGCGYWGPNLLRNFSQQKGCSVKYVVDPSEERRRYVDANFPQTKAVPDFERVLADDEVDATVIATPAGMHYEMARVSLSRGKHTFVEKPLALSSREAEDLIALAKRSHRVLMVGHTFLYNPAVQYLKRMIEAKELGEVYYVYAQRLNLGVIRSDVNALWNLAPHDISIICHLLNDNPVAVSAYGTDYLQPGVEDVVFLQMVFKSKIRANVHVSWLDPNKIRRHTIVGSKKMVVYDDVADDKIAIYDKGFDRITQEHKMPFDTVVPNKLVNRVGDILLPKIDFKEPLKVEAAHFLDCIQNGKTPISDGENGKNVIRVLEAAQESMRNGSRVISL
jgi:predicted dehydrogenase